jgi:hypothetical protein
MSGVRVEMSSPDLVDLAIAIKYEQDGAVMRRDLLRNLRAAVKPAVEEAKASIMALPVGGLRQHSDGKWHLGTKKQPGGSIRSAIRKQVTTEISLSPRSAKVKVKVRKRNMPRNFKNAPKAFQLAGGWRHPVFDQDRWVAQIGKPGWFDVPLRSHRARYKAAVEAAMRQTADRIARKV